MILLIFLLALTAQRRFRCAITAVSPDALGRHECQLIFKISCLGRLEITGMLDSSVIHYHFQARLCRPTFLLGQVEAIPAKSRAVTMPRRAGGAARRPGCCAGGQDCALLVGSGGPIRLGPHGRTRPARARQSAAFPPAASRLQGRSRPGRLPGQPFRVSLTRIAAAMPRQAHGPTGQRDPCWQPATGVPPGFGDYPGRG